MVESVTTVAVPWQRRHAREFLEKLRGQRNSGDSISNSREFQSAGDSFVGSPWNSAGGSANWLRDTTPGLKGPCGSGLRTRYGAAANADAAFLARPAAAEAAPTLDRNFGRWTTGSEVHRAPRRCWWTALRSKKAVNLEAAELFGGGVNAFSRYENGKTKPPLALVKLLKVLDRHPELLNEVRSA